MGNFLFWRLNRELTVVVFEVAQTVIFGLVIDIHDYILTAVVYGFVTHSPKHT